jgi:DnaK suppressor protein
MEPKVAAKPKVDTAKPLAAKKAVKSGAPVRNIEKSASRSASKPAEVAQPGKTIKASAPVKPVTKTKSDSAVAGPQSAPLATAPALKPVPLSIERITPMTSPPVLKPGRRSSARAPSQLPPPAPMVPTHAPDAAKASYSTMTERVIAPPPHVAAKKDPKLANNWKTTAAEALTDEEVKAMPDAEYMNEKQMAFFRHKLSVLKQEIHNSAGETTEHLREDTVVVPDPADRATIEEEHALELRTRDRERKLLKKIEQSIARIDSGDYGYCDETGEPIGVGRLIARPTANLSLEAQQRRELKQKMFGD